jgi:hypothetical protein
MDIYQLGAGMAALLQQELAAASVTFTFSCRFPREDLY